MRTFLFGFSGLFLILAGAAAGALVNVWLFGLPRPGDSMALAGIATAVALIFIVFAVWLSLVA